MEKVKVITGTTKSGFSYTIPEKRLNNFDLLEAIDDLEENPVAIARVVKLLLGDSGLTKLKDHLRDKDGIVPVKKMSDEIEEIFKSQNETKN